MINLFKNRFDRIFTKKAVILIAVVVVPLMIGVAIFFSGQTVLKDRIAFVTEDSNSLPSSSKLNIIPVDEKPTLAELVLGKYSFIVEQKGDTFNVTTLRSNADAKKIEHLFSTGNLPKSYKGEDEERNERGIGTNILGFIVVLILIQGVALSTLYPEDRMLKTFRRIFTTPLSIEQYLVVQSVFTFICLYIPSYLAIVITSLLSGIYIGYSFGMLAILLGILTFLATGFSIFMSSLMDNNISLVTSGVSVVTCLLAGCFISIKSSNIVLDTIYSILPQKAFMTLINGVEMGESMLEFKLQLIYLLICTVLLWAFGGVITKRRMNKGVY